MQVLREFQRINQPKRGISAEKTGFEVLFAVLDPHTPW
jgi:hypothetical protein